MNILFTCAGRRNYLINYFKQALGGEGSVVAADMQLSAPAMVDADIALLTPSIYDDAYVSVIIDIVIQYKIRAIISLNDLELPVLSKNRKIIEAAGARLLVSKQWVINTASDKWETARFIEMIGLRSPKTYISYQQALNAIYAKDLTFPLIVKPRWGSASIGIESVESMEELELAYQLQSIKLERVILKEISSQDMEHAILIQEKIIGQEFGMDILNDFEGNHIGTYARKKISMRAGETDKAVSVINKKMLNIGRVIGEGLRHIGNLDCDIFEVNGELYVLELNPRFGGGYPFSHEAGVNTAAIYIEWLKGNNNISKYINYNENLVFSKCDRLIQITNY
jgi:carbamoyl-phosphate synthase large subunit